MTKKEKIYSLVLIVAFAPVWLTLALTAAAYLIILSPALIVLWFASRIRGGR